MKIDVRVDDEDVVELIRGMLARGRNLAPVMRPISGILVDSIEESFEREANPNTRAPWPALHPLTIAARQLAGNWPGKILQQSGRLAASITPDYGPDFAAAGTNVIYAALQNFGGTIKPKSGRALSFGGGLFSQAVIPERTFAGVWPEHLEEIGELLGRFVTDDR